MKVTHSIFSFIFITLIIALLALPQNVYAQNFIYQEDFEKNLAEGWTFEQGWQIINENGNHVLSGEGHNWARFTNTYDDYRVLFRLKNIRNGLHINFRLNNTGRYFIGFNAQGSSLNKQYWPDTFIENLATSDRTHQPNEWHQIEVIGSGNTITFIVDGEKEWEYTDTDPILEGSIAFETLDESLVYIDDIQVELASTSAFLVDQTIADLTWVRTGGPLGGLGYDIRMKPDNPDRLYVTDSWAGVFISDDGGKNWTPSNEGISARTGSTGDAIPIFCLTVDPTHQNIIWAGTQNTRGIFKSTDGGITWTSKVQGVIEQEGITFRGFAIDPKNSDVVYAAAELSSFVWNNGVEKRGREFDMTAGVVYKTVDGGETWNAVWRGYNLARYIFIDPRDSNVLYVSTGIFDREAANSNPITGEPGGEGILKSTDGGKTWTHINNGLNNLYVGTLFMHPTNPDILIAGTGNNQYSQNSGVYLTKDGGDSWTHTLSTGSESIESVEIAVANTDIVYAGSSNAIYRSENGGINWLRVSGKEAEGWGAPGIRAGFPIDFQVDPSDVNRIFANEYGGGNFLSEDGGKTSMDASRGYTGAQVRAIAVFPNEPGHVIAAARSGIFVSSDGGSNWTGLNFAPVASMEWNAVAIDPSNPQHIVAETNWDKWLVNSLDGGSSWTQTINFQEKVGWHAIAFAPSDPNIIYAGSTGFYSAGSFDVTQPGKGIYVSTNGGKTWKAANNSLTEVASVYSIAIDPANSDVVYAATSNHGLLMTNDGGHIWSAIENGVPETGATFVVINPFNNNIIFAGFDNNALYRSIDAGITWQPSARGMSHEGQITSVVFDPTGSGQVIYAANYFNGVYRSSDGGQKWSQINNGLLMRSVSSLAISSDGLHLYAATEGGGVYRMDMNGQPPAISATSTPITTTQVPPDVPISLSQTPDVSANTRSGSQIFQSPLFWIFGVGIITILFILFWIKRRKT